MFGVWAAKTLPEDKRSAFLMMLNRCVHHAGFVAGAIGVFAGSEIPDGPVHFSARQRAESGVGLDHTSAPDWLIAAKILPGDLTMPGIYRR
jgi:hypothetical protein